MKINTIVSRPCLCFFALVLIAGSVFAKSDTKQVDWKLSGLGNIKQISYYNQTAGLSGQSEGQAAAAPLQSSTLLTNVIDSPPVDGFVPWIVILTTNKRLDELELDAVLEPAISGSLTNPNFSSKFNIGIFDTGASAHVFSYNNTVQSNMFNSTYLTSNTTTVSGVTGSVEAWVTQPIGLFIKGLSSLSPTSPSNPESQLLSTSGFVGESNVSIIAGDDPGSLPDLATAIGAPMSVYYITQIQNDNQITITKNGQQMTGPSIHFYSQNDPNVPSYPNKIPLELRPLGGVSVQYISIPNMSTFNFDPSSPSVIIGNSSQSLFFVSSVDMTEGSHSALDKTRFMLDTGAQITVIGSRIAARLGLNPAFKEFEVKIQGVNGQSIMAPGFYVDSITIPAIGQWLEYTHVPVVLLDIFSPEGGTLDGIIGMNLFTKYNLILKGGGLFLHDDPVLEFERIIPPIPGDIAPPPSGDGIVNMLDLSAYSHLWLTTNSSPNWNPKADIAPVGSLDNVINILDLVIVAQNWLSVAVVP